MDALVLTAVNPGDVEIYDLCGVAVRHHIRIAGLRPGGNEHEEAEKVLDSHLEVSDGRVVCFVASRDSVVVASFPYSRGTVCYYLLGDSEDDCPQALAEVSKIVYEMIDTGKVRAHEYDAALLYAVPPRVPAPDTLTWPQLREMIGALDFRSVQFMVEGTGEHLAIAHVGNSANDSFRISAHWDCDHDRTGQTRLLLSHRRGLGQWQEIHRSDINVECWHELTEAIANTLE